MLHLETFIRSTNAFSPFHWAKNWWCQAENGEPDLVVHNLEELSQAIHTLCYSNKESFARHVNADRNMARNRL